MRRVIITELRDGDFFGLEHGRVYPFPLVEIVIDKIKFLRKDVPRYENLIENGIKGEWLVAYSYYDKRIAQRTGVGNQWTYRVFGSYEFAKQFFDSIRKNDNHLEASLCPVMASDYLHVVPLSDIERVKKIQNKQTESEVA